jgi:NHL repeat
MFISDSSNHRVLKYLPPFTTGMNASVVFGQPDFVTAGANSTQSGMSTPEAAKLDSLGNLFSSDFGFGRALDFQPPFSNGMNASVVIGQPDFTTTSGSGGPTQNDLSGGNVGVALDSVCNLWLSDFGNNRILQFVRPFTNGMNASLVVGQADFISNGSGTTQSTLSLPQFITIDKNGDLWVADYANNRVLEFTPPFSNGELASVVIGQSDFVFNGSGTTQNTLSAPFGTAFDASGNLWVADSFNNRALEFKPPFTNGMNASVVIGQPDFTTLNSGSSASALASCSDVAFDSKGNLFVADPNNNRVVIFAPPFSNGMGASVVIGQPDLQSNAAATTANGLNGPLGVSITP